MNVYLKEQNVTLDLVRFREYLKEMYKKANTFMNKEDSNDSHKILKER